MNDMAQVTRNDMPAGERLASAFFPELAQYEAAALSSLVGVHRFVGRNVTIAREAERLDKLRFFVSGWAMKNVSISNDRRQIIGFVLPGNLEGLHTDFQRASTADVVTLTSCEIAEFSLGDIMGLTRDFNGIAAAFRGYMAREAAYLGDQVLRLGRMTAYERVCHFLLEVFDRQCQVMENGQTVHFPITQSIVADALGLSVVHVNRQIMRLRQERLLDLSRKTLTILDLEAMMRISGYKSRRMPAVSAFTDAAE